MEVVAECIPTKLRAKQSSLGVINSEEKCDDVKTVFLYNRRSPNNTNAQKLRKAQSELNSAYLKEQREYIQDQINRIRDLVEDRQSRIAW